MFSHPKVELLGAGKFHQRVIFHGLGKVTIGQGFSFGYRYGGGYHSGYCEIQPRSEEAIINIGCNVATNNRVFICSNAKIEIGDSCIIGYDVMIMDHDGHGIDPKKRRNNPGKGDPIIIGKNVFLGSKAIILPGTEIGDHSVVGAGAVVKGKYPSNSVIAGNPARIIKEII
jgi:maltose O-acetyltransferase